MAEAIRVSLQMLIVTPVLFNINVSGCYRRRVTGRILITLMSSHDFAAIVSPAPFY